MLEPFGIGNQPPVSDVAQPARGRLPRGRRQASALQSRHAARQRRAPSLSDAPTTWACCRAGRPSTSCSACSIMIGTGTRWLSCASKIVALKGDVGRGHRPRSPGLHRMTDVTRGGSSTQQTLPTGARTYPARPAEHPHDRRGSTQLMTSLHHPTSRHSAYQRSRWPRRCQRWRRCSRTRGYLTGRRTPPSPTPIPLPPRRTRACAANRASPTSSIR